MAVALTMLRRQINPQESPVYRLHPELLLHIASYLPTDDLVKATHTSYHLRTVLLAHSSLWSTLDLTKPEQASTFLTRSKSAAIHLFFPSIVPQCSLPLLELLGQSVERIATLKIYNTICQMELLLRTMPTLESLDFSTDPDDDSPDGEVRWSFPVMKTLLLDSIDFLPLSAPRLTRFSFVHTWAPQRSRPMDGLLDFLSGCLLLEDLVISRVNAFHIERHRDPVHLPCLRLCTHEVSTESHIQLYNLLFYPPSCTVTFTATLIHYRDRTPQAPIFPPFHEPAFRIDPRRVKVRTRSLGYEVEEMVEVIDRTHRRFRSTRAAASGRATPNPYEEPANPLHPAFIKSLDPRFIEVLCIEGYALWPRPGRNENVGEILDHLGNIRTLILSGATMGPCLQALVPREAGNTSEWRCRKLDTLVVHKPHYMEYRTYNVFPELHHFARGRKLAGLPLGSLSVFLDGEWDPEPPGFSPEELGEWVGTFKFVVGHDALLDWSVDDYFLEGLDLVWRD